jgi:MFS family permease
LVEKGRYEEALISLKDIYNDEEADNILKKLKNTNRRSVVEVDRQSLIKGDEEPSYVEIIKCQNGLSKMVRLGILISLFQQFSGTNAILSFSTTIFNSIGGSTFMSRIVNMASALGIFPLVERTGRKKLTLIGGVGMAVCLFLMGFFSDVGKGLGHAPPIICILVFIVFYEGSIGPICWIYSGEILGSRAMSVCMFLNWLCTFIVVLTFSPLVTLITMSGAFFVYAGINLLGFFYFFFDMVETKGLDKGQIWTLLVKNQNS